MMLTLYSLVMRCLQPLAVRRLKRRARAEPGYGVAIPERWGRYTTPSVTPVSSAAPLVWVHAVSLGETIACAALVTELRVLLPGMRLLLTHGTATGRARGASLLQPGDVQVWQPWDTPHATQAFLTHFKPAIGLLMETEVWPNLVAACQRQGVPLCLVNARLSEKSLRQARRLAWLARPAYGALRAVWAQAPADAERLRSLGAPVAGVFGNLKFDLKPDIDQLAQGRAWRERLGNRAANHSAPCPPASGLLLLPTQSALPPSFLGRPVVTLAISREGEEAMLLQILQAEHLQAKSALQPMDSAGAAPENIVSSVQWMIVPRHPQRLDEVAQLCESHGFSVLRRSQWGKRGPADAVAAEDAADAPTGRPVIWLGDTMGEMALYYALSDIALLGGSFAPLGGQNLIEAAACRCPVLMGPHTFNFAQAAELACAAGAGWRVADMSAAVALAHELLLAPARLEQAAQATATLSAANQGAALRTAQAVQALLIKASASH
ncbi:MAG: 3-deoxy-D-manno-octulosonic acid transferase [Burkholderiales bacterium PBB3]|nr:MAG: 3-deoxy-D-manno-octulosonic acid transferase [Burkholderiales bacterium PBB3]